MRIDSRQHASLHGIMLGRGLPRALLRAAGTIEARDVQPCRGAEGSAVPADRQRRDLVRSMEDPRGAWLLVAGSRLDHDLLDLLGLEFFARATRAGLARPEFSHRPLWHRPTGGWSDRLRDDDPRGQRHREEIVGRVGALVLSGVQIDSTQDKIEKVRDLLELYSSVPRVLLVTGGDPLRFAHERLHRRVDRAVFVNRTHARAERRLG